VLAPGSEIKGIVEGTLVPPINKQKDVFTFLQAFTMPLAYAMRCYTRECPALETDIRHDYAGIAAEWRRISRKTSTDPTDDINHLFGRTIDLIKRVREEMKNEWVGEKPPQCSASNVPDISLNVPDISLLQSLFSNGYVISSIASSVDVIYGHEQAIFYMTEMEPHLRDNTDENGKMYFYLARAKAMYRARWYPRKDARKDLDRAREIAEDIATRKQSWPPQSGRLFPAYMARIINLQLYFPIRDWIEGHPLAREEIPRLELWARDLRDRLEQDWAKKYDWDDPDDPADLNYLIPAIVDTLGMSELAIGASTKELDRGTCRRAAIDLNRAFDIFQRQFKKDKANYEDTLKISEAHRELHARLCGVFVN
jgi:hypothetical protein